MESEYWKEKQPQPGQSMCAWAIVATLLLGFQAADCFGVADSGVKPFKQPTSAFGRELLRAISAAAFAVPAANALSHELDIIEFHALSDERRKAPGLVLGEMEVVR